MKTNGAGALKSVSSGKSVGPREILATVALVALMALPFFWQGGFNGLVMAIFGIVSSLAVLILVIVKRKGKTGLQLTVLMLFGLAFVYLLSAAINGFSLTTLSETGSWFAIAAFGLLSSLLAPSVRRFMLRNMGWIGAVSALLGIAMYSGLLVVPGGYNDGRLQYFFQYANTAGLWFACSAVFCLLAEERRQVSVSAFSLLALLFTKSGGAYACFGVALVCLVIIEIKRLRFDRVLHWAGQGFLAIALFAISMILPSNAAIVLPVLALVVCAVDLTVPWENKISEKKQKAICLGAITLLGCLLVVVVALLHDRLADSWTHLLARVLYAIDALGMIASHPVFGVGPDNWQYVYPFVQTSQYHVSIIHNSYLQFAVDAGCVALLILFAFLAIGLKHLYSCRNRESGLAAFISVVLICLHSIFDFDFQFGFIAAFAAFLICDGEGKALKVGRTWTGIVIALTCLFLSVSGLLAESFRTASSIANDRADYGWVMSIYEKNPFVFNDQLMQGAYLNACYSSGDYSRAVAFYQSRGCQTDEQAIYIALSAFELEDPQMASDVLVSEMEKEPNNESLAESAHYIFETYGIDTGCLDRYNAAVKKLNDNANRASSWLPDQRKLDIYL